MEFQSHPPNPRHDALSLGRALNLYSHRTTLPSPDPIRSEFRLHPYISSYAPCVMNTHPHPFLHLMNRIYIFNVSAFTFRQASSFPRPGPLHSHCLSRCLNLSLPSIAVPPRQQCSFEHVSFPRASVGRGGEWAYVLARLMLDCSDRERKSPK